MDRHSIRYAFEHEALADTRSGDVAMLVHMMLIDRDFLYNVIDQMFQKENVKNPYTAEQFFVESVNVNQKYGPQVLKMHFPPPEEETLCYCSYLFWDSYFGNAEYYCIEKAGSENGNAAVIYGWSGSWENLNFGRCALDEGQWFNRCLNLYIDHNTDNTGNDY